jgi:hypothetical protein
VQIHNGCLLYVPRARRLAALSTVGDTILEILFKFKAILKDFIYCSWRPILFKKVMKVSGMLET